LPARCLGVGDGGGGLAVSTFRRLENSGSMSLLSPSPSSLGGCLAFAPAIWIGRLLSRGRADAGFAATFLALTILTVGVTALLTALQYRQYYSTWHDHPFTIRWVFEFVFTTAQPSISFWCSAFAPIFPRLYRADCRILVECDPPALSLASASVRARLTKPTAGTPMIPRYSRPEMVAIWSPETRFRIWFEIEAYACEALAELGVIPKEAAKRSGKRATRRFSTSTKSTRSNASPSTTSSPS
jgi:hypothetical protein